MPSSSFTKEETKAQSNEDTCPIAGAEIGRHAVLLFIELLLLFIEWALAIGWALYISHYLIESSQ